MEQVTWLTQTQTEAFCMPALRALGCHADSLGQRDPRSRPRRLRRRLRCFKEKKKNLLFYLYILNTGGDHETYTYHLSITRCHVSCHALLLPLPSAPPPAPRLPPDVSSPSPPSSSSPASRHHAGSQDHPASPCKGRTC